jgi:hypothetical protein
MQMSLLIRVVVETRLIRLKSELTFNHATRIGPIPRPRPETVIAPALVSRIQNDHRWRV